MSEILHKGKEQIIIVIRGGNLSAVYSSIPDKSVEVELIDYDSREDAKLAEKRLNELIESGATPYEIW